MSATSRFGMDEHPGGLFLVQDLLNTRGVASYSVPDLLATVTDARRWTGGVVRRWRQVTHATGGAGVPTSADLPALRRLREDVVRAVEGERQATRVVACRLVTDAEGTVRLQPDGVGVGWLASAVWGEVMLAQRDGGWERLKICRTPRCPCAFVDVSRNNSRVWHDVRTCGNLANLRASRERRRSVVG